MSNQIRVQGIHAGTINGASPRLRYFRRREYMPADISWTDYDGELNCDVLFIQKRADSIDLVLKAKSKGIPVVYDTDDGAGVRRKGNDLPIFPLVDAITTDTRQRADAFRGVTTTPVIVVPDGIDYMDMEQHAFKISHTIVRVCTFGSVRSVTATAEYLAPLSKRYGVTYITDRKIREFGKCHFKEWKLSTIVKELNKHDVCILAHENSEEKQWKGNVRLITCMAMGLPAIVSNTPSHEDAMRECGYSEFVVSQPEEVAKKIEMLSGKDTRRTMRDAFARYAWINHHPAIFAHRLAELFRSVAVRKE